ncbi:MAG: hypothetical protein Ct9H300mP13_7790 [Gammaproteobacteria bacterium]|nr:MAG: hypothetical protein Ct9H300mP13_7790 [Gammaproteobacteria bacterium]
MNSNEVMTRLPALVNQDTALIRRGRGLAMSFSLRPAQRNFLCTLTKDGSEGGARTLRDAVLVFCCSSIRVSVAAILATLLRLETMIFLR